MTIGGQGKAGVGTIEIRATETLDVIQKFNRQVMHYGPGLDRVTAKYEVERGIRPVEIVSRRRLPMGSNAILFWNQGGNLDPKRLRAGQWFLLPLEPLSLHVYQRRRRMGVFIGDWFVKEFRIGIGREETPTPLGEFRVHSREKNPDWWTPGGKRIPYGHPDNELGSAWIAVESASAVVDEMFNLATATIEHDNLTRVFATFAADLREESGKAVVVIHRPAIQWVVMTLGTLDPHAHEDLGDVLRDLLRIAFHLIVIGSSVLKRASAGAK